MFSFKYIESVIALVVGLIIFTILAIVGGILLKKKDDKTRLLPIKIVWLILIIMEIMKIYYLIGRDQGFYPNRYPIVFCSIAMFTYPIFCFKKNKYSEIALGISTIPMLISVIFVLLTVGNNALIQSNGNFSIIHFHSIIYHLLIYAVSLYIIINRLYKFEFKKSLGVGLFLSGYILMATVLSLYIDGDISFFGPGFNSSSYLAFLYNSVGYVSGNLLVAIAFTLVSILIYFFINLPTFIKRKGVKEND